MNVYELQYMGDNPYFDGLAFDYNELEFLDKIKPNTYKQKSKFWQQPSYQDWWETPKVIGQIPTYQDYPCVNMIYPAFSQRACDALRDMLEPNGELLPLDSECGAYYYYNCQTYTDALDYEQSTIEWPRRQEKYIAGDILRYVFDDQQLKHLSIFGLSIYPIYLYVTESFKQRVEEAGLMGFDFNKVAPYPPGTNWRMENKKLKAQERQRVMAMQQQTVVVLLPLEDKEPSVDEQVHIAQLEDNLDHVLKVEALSDEYYGRYVGHDISRKQYRMFLSCPDADRLFAKLQPWLTSLDWPQKVKCVRRYGSMYDTDARQKTKSYPPKVI